jgi:hypothetical protein
LPEWVAPDEELLLLEEDAATAALSMVWGAAVGDSTGAAGTMACSWVTGEEGRADVVDDEEEEASGVISFAVGTMGQGDWDGASGSCTGEFMDEVALSVVGTWWTPLVYPGRHRPWARPSIGLAETDAAATRAATHRLVRR